MWCFQIIWPGSALFLWHVADATSDHLKEMGFTPSLSWCVNKTKMARFYVLCVVQGVMRITVVDVQFNSGLRCIFGLWFISLFILTADIERNRVMTLKLSFIAVLFHFVEIRDRNVAEILLSSTWCNVLNCKSNVRKIQMEEILYSKFTYFNISTWKFQKIEDFKKDFCMYI